MVKTLMQAESTQQAHVAQSTTVRVRFCGAPASRKLQKRRSS